MGKTKLYENQEGAYMKLVKKIVDLALIFVLMVSMVGCSSVIVSICHFSNPEL